MENKVTCVLIALVLAATLSACGPGQLLGPTLTPTLTQTPTPPPTLTTTLTPTRTHTPVPPTITPSATPEPPTATPTLGIGPTQAYTDGMVGLYVPAGEFLMGSTDAEVAQVLKECTDCGSMDLHEEKPQHTVYLDAFWIDQTDVTNAMFARFVHSARKAD